MIQLTSLWNLVCTASLHSAVLIVIVLALRWLLRGRVPAQCFHWLWVLVAVRLLLPIAPGSATSIFNLLRDQRTTSTANDPRWVVRKDVAPTVAAVSPQPLNGGKSNSASTDSTLPQASGFNLLPIIWLGGVALQFLLLARSAWAMRQSLRGARPVTNPEAVLLATECATSMGTRSRISLLESSAFGGPAIICLWQPRLVLPSGLIERLTPEELRFVLLHEYAHVRRRDLAMMWLITSARVFHWFNPFAWLASRAMRIDTELACDETVLRNTGPHTPVPYGETLLKLSQLTVRRLPAIPAVAIAEGSRAIRLRLTHIASFGIRSRWHTAAAVILVAAVSFVFAADETSKPPDIADQIKADAAQPLPEWAKGWSIARVNLPLDKEASKAEIEFLIDNREKRTLKVGEASETDPWVEKLAIDSVTGASRWKATLRKGEERAEFVVAASTPEDLVQVEIEAKFIETSETTIRRLRLKAPKEGGAGLAMLDDSLRGGETANVLTTAQTGELTTTFSGATGTNLLSAPRVTTRAGQRAVIEIIREFRYPVEWGSSWDENLKKQIWKPLRFETRNTGVTLEVLPTVEKEGTIALAVTPQVVEFLGFKDIDSGKAVPMSPTKENRLNPSMGSSRMDELLKPMPTMGSAKHPVWRCLPVFSTRRLTVTHSLRSGETYLCTELPETETVTPFRSPAASKRLIALITPRIVFPAPQHGVATTLPDATDRPRPSPEAIDAALFGATRDKGKAETAASSRPEATNAREKVGKLPFGKPVSGKPGYLSSPYAEAQGYVDVRGFPSGTEVKCPYTGKLFIVP